MLKAKTAKGSAVNGTCLQGGIDCDYDTLVAVFGPPEGSYDDYKSDCAWDLVINGVVVTIYNYKDGKNYCGANGLNVQDITDWHIGNDRRTRIFNTFGVGKEGK